MTGEYEEGEGEMGGGGKGCLRQFLCTVECDHIRSLSSEELLSSKHLYKAPCDYLV